MDPGPDAGQLRDEAVDTLGCYSFPRDLRQLRHAFDAEASVLQLRSSSLPGVGSEVQSNLDPDSPPYYQHLAAEAAQDSIFNPLSTTHRHHHHQQQQQQQRPSPDTTRHASPPPIDADDFYKNYRGPDASAGPDLLPMAATSSSRSSLRASGDGTTPKQPAASAQHNMPRANLRSMSSPLDNRMSAGGSTRIPTGKPSVKDLKKRFDQNAAVGVPTIGPPPARATAERLKPTKLRIRSPVTTFRPSRLPSRQDATFEDGFGGSGDVVDAGRPTQSLRQYTFVADHQLSGSPQSFASRVGKPPSSTYRGLASNRPITSTQKKPTTLPRPISSTSRHPQARGLLLGVIVPDQYERDADSLGHGTDQIKPRRTSEPCVQIASSHQRNLYSPEIEGPSPSYSHRSPPPRPEEAVTAGQSSRCQPRSRAHSDDGSSSSSSRAARCQSSKSSPHSSKLPVFVRKFSTPDNSPSSSSTRSSSPSTLKRPQANGRQSVTSPRASRAKTPTPTLTQARKSITPNAGNARLQALIAVPTPKLSPTLRSSRPRQPVSIASTSSSRMRESDRARNGRTSESSNRRRKVSIGPIDFEQRREHIRLAYTKSIQESEALEARHKADAEKARLDLETLTLSKDTSERSTASNDLSREAEFCPSAIQAPAAPISIDDEAQKLVLEPDGVQSQTTAPQDAQSPSGCDPSIPLTVVTQTDVTAAGQDSPTLGLPGGFPGQTISTVGGRRPPSVVSASSDTTEFDAEPQIKPPVQALSPVDDVPLTTVNPAPTPQNPSRSEYQYPFHDDSSGQVSPKGTHHNLQEIEFDQATAVPGSLTHDAQNFEPQGLGFDSFQSQYAAMISSSESPLPPSTTDKVSIPFPRLDSHSDSDCQSELDQGLSITNRYQSLQDHEATTDTCTGATDDGKEQGVGVQSRGYYEGASHSYRTSTCASSDVGTFDDAHCSGPEQEQQAHQQYDASYTGHFLMPAPGFDDGKASRQSTWTDFSVDSGDQAVMPNSRESPVFGHVTIFNPQTDSSMNGGGPNRQQSLCESEPSRAPLTHDRPMHHLPEVDTGDGFSVPYFSPDPRDPTHHRPRSPSHESPPVPPSNFDSEIDSRASSAYYEQSRYDEGTPLDSERGSGEYMSRADTSQSLESASFLPTTEPCKNTQTPADSDSKSLALAGEELTEQERHRLVQRRNVIKELVDTEAVFVRDMNIVEEIYKGTAEACPKLDSKTVKLIFRNSDEIITFHTAFLSGIKESVADVYIPKSGRVGQRDDSSISTPGSDTCEGPNDLKDRCTTLGLVFKDNIEHMKSAHEGFLRASDQAAKRLIEIQQDPTVQVWLTECNEVAKDLTAAWNLDSLLIKPMQRITKYPNLIATLLQHTPQDHPDREALKEAKSILETAIIEINRTKKNFELVGQIVGRKRKESDVRAGFARAFGKRVDKLQASNNNNRPAEDADYAKLNEKFGDDYLRLQVVLRDVEFYTRQVSAYVHEFLQYMSSIELVMRLQPGNYPELESKWVQFNISVRDLEKVALEEHLSQVRKLVIEPFEQVIQAYGNPSLAMKKREKRRLDFERFEQLRKGGKSPDPKLMELVEQYDALNDTLKKELPQLSALTEKIGNICLGNFVNIQAKWYSIWKDKMKVVLTNYSADEAPELVEVVTSFERDFPYASDHLANIGILRPATWGRTSISASMGVDDSSLRIHSRPSDPEVRRMSRGLSVNGNAPPMLPAPDFGIRHSGSFTVSETSQSVPLFANGTAPSPHQYYYRDYYAGIAPSQSRLASPRSPEFPSSLRSGAGTGSAGSAGSAAMAGLASTRPSTGRSHESGMPPVQSSDYRDSNTTCHSNSISPETQRDNHRFSNMFRSAMPMSDGLEEGDSQRESRASSRDRSQTSDAYNVLWLAASLFEFNIATTKHEAGYPYLTYQTGELFDVIGEKGELWLAKNQDDAEEQVGWIWSKHFAKLAEP